MQHDLDLLEQTDGYGSTALSPATQRSHLEIVRALLELYSAEPSVISDISGSLMCLAVESGNFELVRYLHQTGVVASQPDKAGTTPSMGAAKFSFIAICQYLVEDMQVDCAQQDTKSNTALHYAVMTNQINCIGQTALIRVVCLIS